MKTVLVVGATGALGRVVVNRLVKEKRRHIVSTSRNVQNENYVELDVRNPDQIYNVLKDTKPDLLINLAATFTNEFENAYAVNVNAARYLLDSVLELNLQTRILLVGSAAEYGIVRPEENPIQEDHPLNPVSIYGLTKAWQTQLASLYASRGANVVVARIFNLDGLGLSEQLFIGRLQKQIDEILAGRKGLIELGPLTAVRDYISLPDATDQLLCIAEYGLSGGVYHVASGNCITMREILKCYLEAYALDVSIVREELKFTNHVGYDVPVIYADIQKTRNLMRCGLISDKS